MAWRNDPNDPTQIGIPSVPSWLAPYPNSIQAEISPADWMSQMIYNRMLPYLDPLTQRYTMQYLYRENPRGYDRYSNVQTGPYMQNGVQMYQAYPQTTEQAQTLTSPARIAHILGQLDINKVVGDLSSQMQSWLAGKKKLKPHALYTGQDIKELEKSTGVEAAVGLKSSLEWLKSALKAAEPASGKASTRADQLLAAQHLDTLFREAEKDELTAGRFKTLFENLVNPVTYRQPLTGVLGQTRALAPRKDTYRRGGVAYRNLGEL